MTKRFLDASVVMATVLLCSFCNLSFPLNIDIKPHRVNGIVHNEVRMKCSLENSDGAVREIMLLELYKDGSAIAAIRLNSEISYGTGMEAKFQAEGNISKSAVFDSYIDVTLKYPEVSDSGMYVCVMYYMDQLMTLKEKRKEGNLTVSDTQILSSISMLRQTVKIQEDSLDSLIARENTSVYFTALHTNTGGFYDGKDIIYSIVKENVGNGYNETTGVFTAPIGGFYFMYLSVTPQQNGWIDIDLKSSKGEILARLQAYYRDNADFSGTSCIVRLDQGERVWPVSRATSDVTLWDRDNPGYLNRFSGHLLKVL